jgi:L-ascorbate metabolism protein UlaG (beta-lactamase superfamily)
MKKFLFRAVLLLIIAFSSYLFYVSRPSGNIDNYAQYYTDNYAQPTNGSVKVTFLGTSTLLFDDGATQILIDGFFTRMSLTQLKLSENQSDKSLIDNHLKRFGMNRVKGLFVTHSHFDHAFDAAYTAQKTGAKLYGSRSTLNIGRGGGLPESQMQLFKSQDTIRLGDFKIRVIPSKHSEPNVLKDDGVEIQQPLAQPAKIEAYTEGGSYDFLIEHKGHSIYVKPSANFVEGALDSLKADVFFCGISTIGKHPVDWQQTFYNQTVRRLEPSVFVPLHWDDFTKPLSEHLEMLPRYANDSPKDFDPIIQWLKEDKIQFRILQGTKSIVLFQ